MGDRIRIDGLGSILITTLPKIMRQSTANRRSTHRQLDRWRSPGAAHPQTAESPGRFQRSTLRRQRSYFAFLQSPPDGEDIVAPKAKGRSCRYPSVPAPRPNLGQALELSVRRAPEVRGSGARCEPDLLQPQS